MAVKFDGSAHKIRRNASLHGAVNSKKFTISGWFWSDGVASSDGILTSGPSGSGKFVLTLRTDGELQIVCRNAAGTIIVNVLTSGAALEDSTWHHFVLAVDLSQPEVLCYIDRVAATLTETTLTADGIIDFESPVIWVIGANAADSIFADFALYDLLFKAGEYVDLSDANNLELFVSSDGRTASGDSFWQNVGPNTGVKPVGYGIDFPCFNFNKPDIYFSGDFQQNKGTGGQFVVSGLPFDAADNEPRVYRAAAHYDNNERWFDSELTGFSYTRSRTFIEQREGHPKRGLRMGIDEMDEPFRQERPGDTYHQLLFNDREDDTEEGDR